MITLSRLLELSGVRIVLTEMSFEQATRVFQHYGTAPSRDTEELKSQFRSLAQKYHPDRGGDLDAMKEINSAYEVLKSAPARSDSSGDDGIRRASPDSPFEDFRDAAYFAQRLKTVSGAGASPVSLYAFDGTRFTATVNAEAALNDKSIEMIREGMLTQGGGNTRLICAWFKNDAKKFVVLYNAKHRGAQRIETIDLSRMLMIDPKLSKQLIAELTRISN